MDQRTPNEWAKIIRDYMTSSNDVVVDDTSEPSSDEDFVETGGLYDWSFRPGNMTAWRAPMGRRKAGPWPEQNSSQTNTGAEPASLPAPLQNSTAQQTFGSPVNYNNQVCDFISDNKGFTSETMQHLKWMTLIKIGSPKRRSRFL